MLRRILVPLDGSRFAEAALPAAVRLSRRDAARLELVTVQEPPLPIARTGGAPVRDPAFDQEVQRQARAYLDVLLGRIEAGDRARTATALLAGRTVETLLEHIQSRAVDLVVMTTHARGGASRAWLGSVADGLVRRSPVPVLLLRPAEEEGVAPEAGFFTRVLLPLDGSPGGEQILERAIEVAGTEGVRYTLLRVLASGESAFSEVLPRRGEAPSTRAQRATVEAGLERTAETLRARGLEVRGQTVTDDVPARAILEYVVENGIDLIAMTTRSRGGLERWLLGSVADKVLRGTTRPLLLFNPTATDADERE
ncbi:MAG TPA: universal stress protein [Gemmatimonadales bacterium]|nr:universal stress protein [Gemmatimonadales bacterium]